MCLIFVFLAFFTIIPAFISDKENYIPILMKRMAPNSINELPKGTKYFIKKHQLIRSTGIELEDDGQVVKLHPDLNGTRADLFPEYPLNMNLRDIQLEIYLNATASSQWKSRGTATFCLSDECYPVSIDDSSKFFGTLYDFSTKNLFDAFSPYIQHLGKLFTVKRAFVIGSLIDILDSEVLVQAKLVLYENDLCDETFAITRNNAEKSDLVNVTVFQSTFEMTANCYDVIPSKILDIFISPSFPNYNQLEKMKTESTLMNSPAPKLRIQHKFLKKCKYEETKLSCPPESQAVPDILISIWKQQDLESPEPTINILLNNISTEIKSKRPSYLTNQFFGHVGDQDQKTSLKQIMQLLNFSESQKISVSKDDSLFDVYLDSKNYHNSCLQIGGLNVCDWQGKLQLSTNIMENKSCPLLTLKGTAHANFDTESIGNSQISVYPTCHPSKLASFHMKTTVNTAIVHRILNNIGEHIHGNDDLLQIFDMRQSLTIENLEFIRKSNDAEEFLSERLPNIITGSTWLSSINGSIPFSLNINAKEKVKNSFNNFCLYLNKNSTLKFISRLTFINHEQLPPMLEFSSVCIQPKVDSSLSKNDVHVRLPVNSLSKCFSTDLLCPFLNKIMGQTWKTLFFEGVLNNNSLSLQSPLVPTTKLFTKLNLTSCFVIYKVKKQASISTGMKCLIYLHELGQELPIFFRPLSTKEELNIVSKIHYKTNASSSMLGIPLFRLQGLISKFYLEEDLNAIEIDVNSYYNEFDEELINQPPLAKLHLNLLNQNKSLLHMVIPPFSIGDITRIVGFGECSMLSSIITDTLDEWEMKVFGLPHKPENVISMSGFNLVQNSLFNSTIQISSSVELSKMVLHGIKPVTIPIAHLDQQAVMSAYSDMTLGPTIILNMECACENVCKENKFGDLISNIQMLGINTALHVNITTIPPWKGAVVSHTFLGQNLKMKLDIQLASLEGPMDITGTILDANRRLVNMIQYKIQKNAKYIINKIIDFEKELDIILHVLNKIRSQKIDIQIKLEESKTEFEEDTTNLIVYETSVNLTCREETCERICIGCASTINCQIKDILGSCVSLSNWDLKCGCSRNPLCMLYNDACEEIIGLANSQLTTLKEKRTIHKSNYESINKKFNLLSRDEAKTELLYSSAMKIALKTIKEMRYRLNEANSIKKDIPIVKWLKVSELKISLTNEQNKTKNEDSFKSLCLFLHIKFNNRINKEVQKTVQYCPTLHGSLVEHAANEISKYLFPNLYNVKPADGHILSKDTMAIDSKSIMADINKSKVKLKQPQTSSEKDHHEKSVLRTRRSNTNEHMIHQILHNRSKGITKRHSLPTALNGKLQKRLLSKEDEQIDKEEANWMIPHTMKGRCRVLLNILDILNDLLKTIHHLRLNHQKSQNILNKQKEQLKSTKDYYLQKLTDSGEQLNLNIEPVNETFQQSLASFRKGFDDYVKHLQDSLSEIDVLVMNEWRKALSERIKAMGGKGIERFLQNLNDVIKTLLKPRNSSSSLFEKIQKQNVDTILMILKRIKSTILDVNSIEDINKISVEYDEAKKLKTIIKKMCH